MSRRHFAIVVLAAALAACATKYGPVNGTGGYSESWRSKDRVVIQFNGNGFSDPRTVQEMTLLRAAELALNKGYPCFLIISESEHTDLDTTSNGIVWEKPKAKMLVAFLPKQPPDDMRAYDAAEVYSRLYAKYLRK